MSFVFFLLRSVLPWIGREKRQMIANNNKCVRGLLERMSSWNFIIYYSYRFHTFLIRPETSYDELIRSIRTRLTFIVDSYLLEIYDVRFRMYVVLNDEFIRNLQKRLPKITISTFQGRIRKQTRLADDHQSKDRKRQRTASISFDHDHIIIWLDPLTDHSIDSHALKHQFHVITTGDIARPMLDYESCIDELIQNQSQIDQRNQQQCLTIFSNQEECLNFLAQVESTMKILFVLSNISNADIIPLIVKRVQMIYILGNAMSLPTDWKFGDQLRLLIFDNNLCLLVRLIRDLARNILDRAALVSKSSVEQTVGLLKWARKLFQRTMKIDSSSEADTLRSIDRQLEKLETYPAEKDEKFALECDEG